MKTKDVIQKFIQKEDAISSTGSVKSINGYLYSYSLRIAKNLDTSICVFPATAEYSNFYTNTTSKHVSQMLTIFENLNIPVYIVLSEKELEEITRHPII